MSSRNKILVTGASGFIGSHVVDQLLKGGYSVRGISRPIKVDQLRKNCPHPNFEVTAVDDLIAGDLSEALQNVTGVIHIASPKPSAKEPVEAHMDATMNVIRQAYAANVYKVILMSSFSTVFTTYEELYDRSRVLTNKDWRKVTKEDVKPDSSIWDIYVASKTIAERAAWGFAESHPDLDLTTLIPPFVFGPLAPAHVISDCSELSTNIWLYRLLARPTASYPVHQQPPAYTVDVRDVAIAAVRALSAPKQLPAELQQRGQRRFHLFGGSFAWVDVVRHLAQVRPELKGRLVEDDGSPCTDQGEPKYMASIDITPAKEILEIESFIGWHQMVEDTIDSILEREATWAN